MQSTPRRKKASSKNGYYDIKQELFWSIGLTLLSAFFAAGFYAGNTKFDKNLIELSDLNKKLEDTIANREKLIKYLRHNSDTALDIIAHMPYTEMSLDTLEFRKVQTTIENAGAVLILNK